MRDNRVEDAGGLAVSAANSAGWTIRPMGGPDRRGLTLNSIDLSGGVSADQAIVWDDLEGRYNLQQGPTPAVKGE